jgi:tetratricopeptide (TPR) repeat protein
MAKKKRKRNQKRTARRPKRRRKVASRSKRKAKGKARATRRKVARARPVARAKVVKPRKVIDPKVAQAMKVYEEAILQFNKQNFHRARDGFSKVLSGPSRELAERARVHLAICEQRLQCPAPVRLRGADDHYHYAVSQINLANYEEARVHLEKARKLSPKSEYIHYALASVAALTGEAEDALEYLTQAIELRPENRYHARNDADFKLLEDDTRFQELVNSEPVSSERGALRA